MMASRKSGAGVSRPRQISGKKGSMMQFVLIGAAVVVLIVVVLVLSKGGAKNKPTKVRAKATTDEDGVAARRSKKSPSSLARVTRSDRDEAKARRHEEKARRREEARADGGSRTSRKSDGGYGRGSSRSSQSDPSQLRAILTDGSGSRFALVGERRFKSGDDIEGHRIVEVTNDGVKVEYRQNTYTVKVGQKVY
jgi:hypothetical protein